MPYISVYVDTDEVFREIDDEDLIEEVRDRKLKVDATAGGEDDYFDRAVEEFKRQNYREGFIYLERAVPALRGLLPRNLEK